MCSNSGGQPDFCWEIRLDGSDYGYYGCEDGNSVDGDGCNWMGQVEPGWLCNNGRPGVADECWTFCEDGLNVGAGATAFNAVVGGAPTAFPETCDDGLLDGGLTANLLVDAT